MRNCQEGAENNRGFKRAILRTALFGMLFGLIATSLGAQSPVPPSNDVCLGAIRMEPGSRLTHLTNAGASFNEAHVKVLSQPATCIPTLENDVWFKFQSLPGYHIYEVITSARYCDTPAGLQMLLIENDNCKADDFHFVGCSSRENMDTIRVFLETDQVQDYLIYVDGFSGTICEFDIEIKVKDHFTAEDLRQRRFDYVLDMPHSFEPDGFQMTFENNLAVLRWEAEPTEDLAFYVVERYPDLGDLPAESHYAQVVGIVDPRNMVGAGKVKYEFADYITKYQDGETYTYRLIKVDSKGERFGTPKLNLQAGVITDFFMGEVNPTPQPGKYVVPYNNRKKKQDYTFQVLDAEMKELKQFTLYKEPVRDGLVTVDMSAYDPGLYFIRMSHGDQYFLRSFTVTGK